MSTNNIDLEDILFGAKCLLDLIEMAPPGSPLIWIGDRKTKVVDLPHFKKAKQIIDFATDRGMSSFSSCACQLEAKQHTGLRCQCENRLVQQDCKEVLSSQ